VITLTDPDLDLNAGVQETVSVHVTSTSDGAGIWVTLKETGVNTGIFTSTDQGMDLGVTTGSSDDVNELIKVAAGNTVTVTYADAEPAADRTGTALWYLFVTGVVRFNA
jgi:hypothetical protein